MMSVTVKLTVQCINVERAVDRLEGRREGGRETRTHAPEEKADD